MIIFGLAIILDVVRSAELIAHNRAWLAEYAVYIARRLPIALIALAVIWVGRSRRWDVAGVVLLSATAIYGMSGWTISPRT